MKQTVILLGVLVAGLTAGFGAETAMPLVQGASTGVVKAGEPIKPIPLEVKLHAGKVALGKQLFNERKLSKDGTISCASCHDFSKGGTDGQAHSVGMGKTEGEVNAPSVFNCGFNFKQFWDGRAHTLEDQIDGPIQAPGEMGTTWAEVVGKLRATPEYVAAFKKIYPDGIKPANVKDAIAQFERSLITPNGRFDKYLRGDDKALTVEEKKGYRKFKSYGCTSCHQGVNVGGNMFETLGTMTTYLTTRGPVSKADLGRFNVTGKEEDKFSFKVPSLRNVAVTGPYFHDGSVKALEEAVAVMGRTQLGRELTPEDIADIVGFLKTLTGEYEGKSL